jgi:hypothetical protein
MIGTAQPSGDALDVRLSATGEPLIKPDACALINDQEITAMLPGASNITREPRRITYLPHLETGPNGLPSIGSSEDLPRGGCVTQFDLPGGYYAVGWIRVYVPAISTPEAIAQYYADRKQYDATYSTNLGIEDLGRIWGAEECYVDDIDGVNCRLGHVFFEASTATNAWRIGQDDYEDSAMRDRSWRDRVLPLMVTTLVAKMS